MTKSETVLHESYPDTHHDLYSKTVFGFWIYLLTDFMLFATLFAVYAVLGSSSFRGPPVSELLSRSHALIQTLVLLTSSCVIGLAGAAAHRKNRKWTIALFVTTFFLGMIFMWMELHTLSHLIEAGSDWKKSGFLSALFTLVVTHGVHLVFALLWIIVLIVPVCFGSLTSTSIRRLTCLRMFWQFLNIIWVFIFSIVYLI